VTGSRRAGGVPLLVAVDVGTTGARAAAFDLDGTRFDLTELSVDAFGIPTRATGTWAWAGGGSAKATLGPAPLIGLAMVPAGVGLRGTGRATLEAAVRSPADVTGTALDRQPGVRGMGQLAWVPGMVPRPRLPGLVPQSVPRVHA